jgi:hypothetical protein
MNLKRVNLQPRYVFQEVIKYFIALYVFVSVSVEYETK